MALPNDFFDDILAGEYEPPSTPTGVGIDQYDQYFEEASKLYNVSKSTLKSIGKQESDGDPYAISSAGAMGIMQFMPETATEMGLADPFDPRENILAGAKYFRQNLDKLGGKEELAIAAHKAGPGAIERLGRIPTEGEAGGWDPYVSETTQDYVDKIFAHKATFREKIPDDFFDDIIGEQKPAEEVAEIPVAPAAKYLPPTQTAPAETTGVSPEFLSFEEAQARMKKRGVAETFGRGLVGSARALASKIPPVSVGMFTFPTRVLTGAAAALEDFIHTADASIAAEGFKQGYSGERDLIGASAVEWDKLAAEAEKIIGGERTTEAQKHQDMLANQIVVAAFITSGGASFAKTYPGLRQGALDMSRNILKKAKASGKTYKRFKLTKAELKNVQDVHQGRGARTVDTLSPREKAFYESVIKDADDIHLAAIKTGEKWELMWPWEKIKTPKAKMRMRTPKGTPTKGGPSLSQSLQTIESTPPTVAGEVDMVKVDAMVKAWMKGGIHRKGTGKIITIEPTAKDVETIAPKSPEAQQMELFEGKPKPPEAGIVETTPIVRSKIKPTKQQIAELEAKEKGITPPQAKPPKEPIKIIKKVAPKPATPVKPKLKPKVSPKKTEGGFVRIPEGFPESAKKKVPKPIKDAYEGMVTEIKTKLFEGSKIRNTVNQKLTPKEREAASFLIERTNIPKEFKRPDLEKLVSDKKAKDKIMSVAGHAQKHLHKRWEYMVEAEPDLSDKEIENYITHIWDVPKNRRQEATTWFKTRNPYLKKRFFRTLEAGIKKGYMPKTTDLSKIMEFYDEAVVRATENKKFLKVLLDAEDAAGVKLIQRADKAPVDWKYIDHPLLRKAVALPTKVSETVPMDVRKALGSDARKVISYVDKKGNTRNLSVPKSVAELKEMGVETKSVTIQPIAKMAVRYHPDLEPVMQATFGRRWGGSGTAGKLLQLYEAANGIQKKTQLTVSLFHPVALGETSLATIGPKETAKILFNAKSLYRALKENRYDIYESKFEVAKDGIQHGLEIGAISDVHRAKFVKMLEGAERGLEKVHKNLGLPVKGISKANSLWDKALWDYLHNNLKVYGYEALTGKMIPKLVNPTPEKIDALKKEVARFVNDTYGGQNWELMMTNPKSLQMAQWFLLSPDWTLSTARQGISFTGLGATTKETRGTRARMGGAFWLRAAFYFGLGINGLNYILTKADDATQKGKKLSAGKGKFLWQNDPGHKTHLFVGRYADGSKRYIRWGKQFRELIELIYDQVAMQVSPATATLRKLGGKTAPNVQLFSALTTGRTPSGYKVKTLADAKGWPWVKAAATHILSAPIPFALKNTVNETKEFHLSDLAFPSSKGMTYYKAKKLFKYALLKNRKDAFEKIFTAAVENNLNAYDIFEDAVRDVKADASSEIGREVRAGKVEVGKTPREIKAITKEYLREHEKQHMLNNWEAALLGARERYNAFLDEMEFMGKELPSESHVKPTK